MGCRYHCCCRRRRCRRCRRRIKYEAHRHHHLSYMHEMAWCEIHHRKEMLSATIVIRMHIQAQLITGILSFLLPSNAFKQCPALRNCDLTLIFFPAPRVVAAFPHAFAFHANLCSVDGYDFCVVIDGGRVSFDYWICG